ncbi:MAG: formyltransferase family protein [Patescibacteria group bacterium]
MILEKVLFLAADTARTKAYRKAMSEKGFEPEFVVPFTGDVNADHVSDQIIKAQPKLIIYSGYGGQIVGKKILDTKIPVLHVHGGFLPYYKGSTTIYYSLLKDHECGASAILLSSRIDSGVIVKRKKYPAPKSGTDIDYVYDNEIRADLLVTVLEEWQKHGDFSEKIKQDENGGTMYYVIHPVLKHLAILSL